MVTQNDISLAIASLALNPNEYLVGYADLQGLLDPRYKNYDYGIAVGQRLDDAIIDEIKNGPTLAYSDHYREINQKLADVLCRIDREIQRLGIQTLPIPPTVTDAQLTADFEDELRYPFSHKMAATRAGLGWIGKTDLFVSKRFGPRLRLATLLIGHPVRPESAPIERSRCGECRRCVDACPAGAATGTLWDITVDRDCFYNPHKCRKACRELSRKNFQRDESLCGICIAVCPISKSK